MKYVRPEWKVLVVADADNCALALRGEGLLAGALDRDQPIGPAEELGMFRGRDRADEPVLLRPREQHRDGRWQRRALGELVQHRQRRRGPGQVVADAAIKPLALRPPLTLIPHARRSRCDRRPHADPRRLRVAAVLADCEVGHRPHHLAGALEEPNLRPLEKLRQHAAAEVGHERPPVRLHLAGDEAGVVHVGGEDPSRDLLIPAGQLDQQVPEPVARQPQPPPAGLRPALDVFDDAPFDERRGGDGTEFGQELHRRQSITGARPVSRPTARDRAV